ncbi:MAG TPA: glycosyltransferase family 39 protein [Chroococcidiopsis sp.]
MVIGIFFRFANLDNALYWKDEAYTSLRISGYTKADFLRDEFQGQVLNYDDLAKYQQLNPDKGIDSTISSLAADAPQHPPLYFTLARFTTALFGNDGTLGPRFLTAISSLLIFPIIYWLCLELFQSPLIGWIAMALVAVSPMHLLYAQEARQYSLWAGTTLLSGALLLRAMRLKTTQGWFWYGASVVLGLYVYLFTILNSMAQGLYVIVSERLRVTKVAIAWVIASFCAIVLYAPWIWVIIDNSARITNNTGWTKARFPLTQMPVQWLRSASYTFFDLQNGYNDPLLGIYVILPLMALTLYAFYVLIKQTPLRTWFFVVTLIVVPFLALAIPDIVSGGVRSITPRYIFPVFLGLELAVAYLLGTQLTAIAKLWQQTAWQLVAVMLISGGILSCAVINQSKTWWTKYGSYYNAEVADVINSYDAPLLISSDDQNVNVLALWHLLDPKVKFQLVTEPALPDIPAGFKDVLVHNVSDDMLAALEGQNYTLDMLVSHQSPKTTLARITR